VCGDLFGESRHGDNRLSRRELELRYGVGEHVLYCRDCIEREYHGHWTMADEIPFGFPIILLLVTEMCCDHRQRKKNRALA
jgi:hypothetical protein